MEKKNEHLCVKQNYILQDARLTLGHFPDVLKLIKKLIPPKTRI